MQILLNFLQYSLHLDNINYLQKFNNIFLYIIKLSRSIYLQIRKDISYYQKCPIYREAVYLCNLIEIEIKFCMAKRIGPVFEKKYSQLCEEDLK